MSHIVHDLIARGDARVVAAPAEAPVRHQVGEAAALVMALLGQPTAASPSSHVRPAGAEIMQEDLLTHRQKVDITPSRGPTRLSHAAKPRLNAMKRRQDAIWRITALDLCTSIDVIGTRPCRIRRGFIKSAYCLDTHALRAKCFQRSD